MEQQEVSATRARQATKGRPVLYVLLGGLALGVLYIMFMLLFPATETLPPSTGVVTGVERPTGSTSQTPTADPQVGRTPTQAPKSAQ